MIFIFLALTILCSPKRALTLPQQPGEGWAALTVLSQPLTGTDMFDQPTLARGELGHAKAKGKAWGRGLVGLFRAEVNKWLLKPDGESKLPSPSWVEVPGDPRAARTT